jgi:hypothetical protein
MTLDDWRPFGQQDDSERLYEALHDGVPPWMSKAHFTWQKELLTYLFSDADDHTRLHHWSRISAVKFPFPPVPLSLVSFWPSSATSKT